jgi:hypothetical protein
MTMLFCLCEQLACWCHEMVEPNPTIVAAIVAGIPYVLPCDYCAQGWHLPAVGAERVWYPHPNDTSEGRDPTAPTH